MEKKYNISSVVTDVIKESSIDCLQNTKDNINIHQNCIQFDKALIQENSYYPGITADRLNIIDNKQIQPVKEPVKKNAVEESGSVSKSVKEDLNTSLPDKEDPGYFELLMENIGF